MNCFWRPSSKPLKKRGFSYLNIQLISQLETSVPRIQWMLNWILKDPIVCVFRRLTQAMSCNSTWINKSPRPAFFLCCIRFVQQAQVLSQRLSKPYSVRVLNYFRFIVNGRKKQLLYLQQREREGEGGWREREREGGWRGRERVERERGLREREREKEFDNAQSSQDTKGVVLQKHSTGQRSWIFCDESSNFVFFE